MRFIISFVFNISFTNVFASSVFLTKKNKKKTSKLIKFERTSKLWYPLLMEYVQQINLFSWQVFLEMFYYDRIRSYLIWLLRVAEIHCQRHNVCILNIRCEITSDKHDTLTGSNLIYLDQRLRYVAMQRRGKLRFALNVDVWKALEAGRNLRALNFHHCALSLRSDLTFCRLWQFKNRIWWRLVDVESSYNRVIIAGLASIQNRVEDKSLAYWKSNIFLSVKTTVLVFSLHVQTNSSLLD